MDEIVLKISTLWLLINPVEQIAFIINFIIKVFQLILIKRRSNHIFVRASYHFKAQEFRNLREFEFFRLTKLTTNFKHLQLISIKNRIFIVSLNIFLFNNWKKSNARRFLHSEALKWYKARRTKNHLGGKFFYRTPDLV